MIKRCGDSKCTDKTVQLCVSLLERALHHYHPRDFAVRLWSGAVWGPEEGQPVRFTWVIRRPEVLRKIFLAPSQLSLAEAYISGQFDIEGDLEEVFPLAEYLLHPTLRLSDRLRYGWHLLRLPSDTPSGGVSQAARMTGARHSLERDKQAVTYHYDRSPDFYALWLDPHMVYSCAYFATSDEDLDTAQARKLDYLCRKLRLRPGERLLDIGCGWGGLMVHAVRHYGVRAVGITLSQRQAEFADTLIKKWGIVDRCRVIVRDYRQLEAQEAYDKIVSVGMVEHVGEAQLPEYFLHASRLLKPGGVFLNHGIGARHSETSTLGPFVNDYIFPDAELLSIATTLGVAEAAGFEVRDVENLREHYVLTLRRWRARLEANREQVVKIADELSYRIWRLYLASAAYGFRTGRLNVYQTLLCKPVHGASGLPLTRGDWYA
jgi:cyclopropane-fatty-acyl-phospholipid synthase